VLWRSRLLASPLAGWLRPLVDLRFWGLWLAVALALFGLAQRPLHYGFSIGREDGRGSDLPFVNGWNTPETAGDFAYRWSSEESRIALAGLPRSLLVATLQFLRADANPAVDTGSTTIVTARRRLATIPLAQARVVHLLVPPVEVPRGRLELAVLAPTWVPVDDPRLLGVPVSHFSLDQLPYAADAGAFNLAPVPRSLGWPLLALPLLWLPASWWSRSARQALVLLLLLAMVLLALLVLDRPRFALAGRPALVALCWSLGLSAVLRVATGRYSGSLGVQPSLRLLNGLALLFFLLFTLRYAGRIYPESMPGDIGFHVNRENDVIDGDLFIVSRHRGIDFPYPPALYLLLLPFRLLPISPESLVDFADAFFGALGLFPLAYLGLRGLRDERVTWLSTSAYVLLAPAIMALWWSFLPHIFAQELVVALLAGMLGGWNALRTRRGVILAAGAFTLLFTSHFGFYLNISLLVVASVLLCLLGARIRGRGLPHLSWQSMRGLLIAFAVAQILALLLFYSAYATLIVDKLTAFGRGGMSAVQGRQVDRSWQVLLGNLWWNGLAAHYAVVGVPFALLGAVRLWRAHAATLLPVLYGATLLVVVVQGSVPFLTASDITTRWLSFAAWVVALGTGLVLDLLWRRGYAGRLLALGALFWIGSATWWMWLQALAFRSRPPEPF
jgi:hypothetical protein